MPCPLGDAAQAGELDGSLRITGHGAVSRASAVDQSGHEAFFARCRRPKGRCMIQTLVGTIVAIAGIAMLLERSWPAGCILLVFGAGFAVGGAGGSPWFWAGDDGDGIGGGDCGGD